MKNNRKMTDAQIKAQKKYNENSKHINIKYTKNNIEEYKKIVKYVKDNNLTMQGYIKELIKKDLKEKGIIKE